MGFLDKVTKAVSDTVDGVSKAVSDATAPSSSTGAPPPPGADAISVPDAALLADLARATPDDWFFNALEPQDWVPAELIGAFFAPIPGLAALVFGSAQTFTRDDAVVARHTSGDGSVTVDFVSYTESFLARVGDLTALFETAAADLHDRHGIGAPAFDGYEQGSAGAGHARAIAALGDSAAAVDVYAPATVDPTGAARALLDAAYRVHDPRFS